MDTPRTATVDDHEWLYTLHRAAHGEIVERVYGRWDDLEQRRIFGEVLRSNDVLVFERDGIRVAAVYSRTLGGSNWVELIEVVPEYQGNGVGADALQWVVNRAVRLGKHTDLRVHKVNERAYRFYVNQGFHYFRESPTHRYLRHL